MIDGRLNVDDERPVAVRCRAEHRYPQDPTAVQWQGQWVAVDAVLARWREPGGWRFRLRGADGRLYEVRYDQARAAWFGRTL